MLSIQRSDELASEIARSNVAYVDKEASVLAASKLMRESGATQLLVTEVTEGVFVAIGIVTAGDIVTRVIAHGLDPALVTAGDITWSGSQGRPSPGPCACQEAVPEVAAGMHSVVGFE